MPPLQPEDRIERIDSHVDRRPLFATPAARAVEQAALATVPAFTLMARAGAACARLALAVAPHARSVRVFAGPGNNGGDGLEAARCLREWGRAVTVQLVADAARLPADAARALARARDAGVPIGVGPSAPVGAAAEADGTRAALVVDALLGIGASRPPAGAIAEAVASIQAARAAGVTVLAIDVPTGLDPDRGQPFGDACVSASDTLSLLTLQPGLFTAAGRDQAGTVWLAPLGIDVGIDVGAATGAADPSAWLVGAGGLAAATGPRRHTRHKGSFGDVAVVGGAPGMTGAALLAARAAHAAGAGRVFVDLLRDANAGAAPFDVDPLRPELMVRDGWWHGAVDTISRTTVVCGCGGGDAVRAALPRLIALAPRLVLDADALNAIAADRALAATIAARSARRLATVLTPHPLEAARLLDRSVAAVQADRLGAARELAERLHAIVVLKGSGSIIAAPGGVPAINATGNAALASAGTGDVLAGWIGGRWASVASLGADDEDRAADAEAIVVRCVVEHGLAAEPARPGALRAGDLVEALHRLDRGNTAP